MFRKTGFLLSALAVLLLCSSLIRNKYTVSIDVKIRDCRTGDTEYLAQVDVFKDGKKFKTYFPKWDGKIEIDRAQPGLYEFKYFTLFNKYETDTVNATKPGHYDITLCTSYLNYKAETFEPYIDKIQPGDEYSICFSSRGCFHSVKDTLTISRTISNYFSKYGSEQKALDSADIEVVRRFEFELNYMNAGGCTTSDEYTILQSGNQMNWIIDGSCEWHGFKYLLQSLDLNREQKNLLVPDK